MKHTTNDYISELERDLLELPGEPYARCAICKQVCNTNSMRSKYWLLAKFWCCEGECEHKADQLCGAYYEGQLNY